MQFHDFTTPTKLLCLLLLLLLLPLTTAHVKLVHPTPYGASTLNTNPLLTTGADYPCKLRPNAFAITAWNTVPLSTPQTLSFQGQATHGGGSCQISLTRDVPPTAESVFRVIKSIEGGCPSAREGNVGTDPEGFGADAFEWEVPAGVGVGEFTLAWSWFNKVGEREMYMNCAPVRVVAAGGGTKKRASLRERRVEQGTDGLEKMGEGLEQRSDGLESLPVMFRANSGNGCSTAESGTVLGFPEGSLGSVVQRIGDEVLVPPVGSCGNGSSVVSVSTDAVSSAAPPTSQASLAPAPSVSVSPLVAQAPPVSSASPVSTTAQASQVPAAPASSPAAAPSTPGMAMGTCPVPGKSVCSPDGRAWGTCMEDHRVIFQAVAAGTRCDLALGVEVPV